MKRADCSALSNFSQLTLKHRRSFACSINTASFAHLINYDIKD
nr:MAG TPA: hypothetical protein [Caudoviricetes sp.]